MHRGTHKISKLLLLMILWVAVGCSEAPTVDPPLKEPEARVYPEKYEKVWRAVQQSMRQYPVRLNSMDSGILETEYVIGDKIFSDPNYTAPRRGYRYKMTVRVVKGSLGGRGATKVTIIKSPEVKPDFFSDPQPLQSNGLEEATILYRIGRYLDFERLIK